MKITAFLLFIAIMQVSAKGFSQKITLHLKNAPLDQAFTAIEKQTGFRFIYTGTQLEKARPVDIDVTDSRIENVLDLLFQNQHLTYALNDRIIVVRLKDPETKPGLVDSLPPANTAGEIHGRITNEKGEPLSNANVTNKRTGDGTITGANGEFSLRNVKPSDQISVSFIGYKKQTIKIGDRTNFTLILETTTDELDKVVIQAYGTTSQRLTTGNIGTVRAKDIEKQPVMNVLDAIQGQVAGVVVTNTSGYASGTVKVEVRGRSSINPNFPSDPLYIIDGVPLTILELTANTSYNNGSRGVVQSGLPSPANGQSPLYSMNPMDIESVEVLKDADATAIYGSRGANGVILITTKKGKIGKTKFDINVATGYSKITRYYNLLNTQQYVAMRKEALANDELPINQNTAPDLTLWDTTRYTDWQKYLWGGTGRQTNAEATLSGGDKQTTFRISAGYNYLSQILTANGSDQRGSLSFNFNHNSLDQRLALSLSATYTITSNNMIFYPGNAVLLPPNAPAVWDSKGNLNFSGWGALDYLFNFSNFLQPYNAKTNFLTSSLNLNYEILKGLFFRTNLGYNNIQNSQMFLTPIISQNPRYSETGSSNFGYSFVNNVIIEPQLEYNSYINKGKLTILGGASYQTNSTTSESFGGQGYLNDALLTSVSNAPVRSVFNNAGKYNYAALFARVGYNWENKYILNLNARRDGSSRFGPGRQFGNFASVGAAWIFSENNFIKQHLSFLSFGKIRGSYGTTGSDLIGDYTYLSLWSFNNLTYNNTLALSPLGHTDSLVQWEVNKKVELALDLGFFKDRLTFSASWYRNRSDNQLIQFPTPSLTGFPLVVTNSPATVENQGWEFVLNATDIETKNTKWTTRFNIGINRNKLISYPNLSQSPFASSLVIGQSLNIRKVLQYTGVDPQTGLYTFKDRNKDGQITVDPSGRTVDDRYSIDISPKFDGGFTNTVTYKRLELSIFFYFRKQMGRNALTQVNPAGDQTNQPIQSLNRWQKPGDIATTARYTTMPYDISFQNYQSFADIQYTDASFIRLQNLSLSYAISENLAKKAGMVNARIYIHAENLFVITGYKGTDPEVQFFGGIPPARTISAGISCNF